MFPGSSRLSIWLLKYCVRKPSSLWSKSKLPNLPRKGLHGLMPKSPRLPPSFCKTGLDSSELISFPPHYVCLGDWRHNFPGPGNPLIFFTYYAENIGYSGKHCINERKVLLCFVWDVFQASGEIPELPHPPHLSKSALSNCLFAGRGCSLQCSGGQAWGLAVCCWIPTAWHSAWHTWGMNNVECL